MIVSNAKASPDSGGVDGGVKTALYNVFLVSLSVCWGYKSPSLHTLIVRIVFIAPTHQLCGSPLHISRGDMLVP